jgi:hypothetical protein
MEMRERGSWRGAEMGLAPWRSGSCWSRCGGDMRYHIRDDGHGYKLRAQNLALGSVLLGMSLERLLMKSAHFQAILLFLGCVGTTATGRSHKFWICGGIYGLIVWAILCISVLVSEVRKGGSIRTDRFYNHSGWNSKSYVYLLGWQYSTIASGVVSFLI